MANKPRKSPRKINRVRHKEQLVKRVSNFAMPETDDGETGSYLVIPNFKSETGIPSVSDDHNLPVGGNIEGENGDEFYDNSNDQYFYTTRSKTEIAITAFLKQRDECVRFKSNACIFGSVFLTLVTTFVTTNFVKFLVDEATWRAIYIIICAGTGCYALYNLIRLLIKKTRNQDQELLKLLDNIRGKRRVKK